MLIRPRPVSGNRPELRSEVRLSLELSLGRQRTLRTGLGWIQAVPTIIFLRASRSAALAISGSRASKNSCSCSFDPLPRRVAQHNAESAVPAGDRVEVPVSGTGVRSGTGAGTPDASGRSGTPPRVARSPPQRGQAARPSRSVSRVALVGQVTPVTVFGHTNAAHQASAWSFAWRYSAESTYVLSRCCWTWMSARERPAPTRSCGLLRQGTRWRSGPRPRRRASPDRRLRPCCAWPARTRPSCRHPRSA